MRLVPDMRALLGVVTTAGGIVGSLTAIGVFLGLFWKLFVKRAIAAAKAVYDWARATEQTTKDVARISARIEKVIGTNGGSTLFERLDSLEDGQQQMASIADVVREPSILFNTRGEVVSVNFAFRKVTGWSEADLQYGGWRSKLADADVDDWDDAVAHERVFERRVTLRGFASPMTAHIRPIVGKRFVGWRGVFEVH